MAELYQCSFSPALISNSTLKPYRPSNSLLCPNFYKPFSFSSSNPRLRTKAALPKRAHRLLVVSGLVDGNSETYPEAESSDQNVGATIDTKLPRRSLLVQFTCNECGVRSQRLINRLVYERGLVFVQCAGCEQYHKLADNLGLVVEYDLREELSAESNADQV